MCIFVVEDSPADARIILESILGAKFKYRLFRNGEELLTFLAARKSNPLYTNPNIILLDLNLPGKSGFEILAQLRKDPDMAKTPVVILSTSDEKKDKNRSLELGADAFLTKPFDSDGWQEIIRVLQGLVK